LADLKGSTALLADRDPEEARKLLDPVLEHMIDAVHHYEGTVNQVMGDGIMALFGAPLAHEDHAVRACFAALRMQERVGRYGDEVQRTHGFPVQIRVGINSGDVVVRSIGSDLHLDYTAVGQTTNLAGRLEQMARPGSTLLAPETLRLVEGYVRVRSLGPVPIRGLGEPVEVFELLGAETGRTRLQVSAARGLTRFIGRDAELEQLRAALERARSGLGQVVAVVGEPGVGKSRLVLELTHSHRTDGWLMLEASAVSYGKAAPFLPVIELMKAYFGVADRDDARRVREKVAGKLLTLDEGLRPELTAILALLDVPVDDASWKSLGAERQRKRTLEAVRRVLLRESQTQPLLLVFEDLHWIDDDTRALLESLVESLPSHRVLLLVNYRPEYRHAWGSKTYYGQIRLDPLAAASAEALLDALLGDDRELAPLRSLLIARTEGNPFFLEESVRALAETGVLGGQRGAYRLVRAGQIVQLPATVQALLAARIDRLPPDDKSLLQSASVIGTTVPLTLLRAIAERPGDDLAARLAELQSAEFIYETRLFPEAEYQFKHALTQEVAYEGLLHERRRALHAQVVAAIERLYPSGLAEHRDQLVYHAFRGAQWAKAVDYLRDLGEVASPEEIEGTMGMGPESAGQLWWMGEHERALRAAERDLAMAASFRHFGLRVVASCRLGQAHHALGDYRRAADVFRQIVDSIQGELVRERFGMAAFPSVWARSWLAWTLAELGDFADAIRVADEATEIAETGDHAYSRIQACWGVGILHMIQGRLDRAVPALEQGLVSARLENIPFLLPFISAPLGGAYALAGRVDSGIALLEQSVEQAAATRLVANHSLRLAWLAWAELLGGRRDAALGHARRALDIATDRQELGQQARVRRLLADIEAGAEAPDVAQAEAGYRAAIGLAESLQMRPLAAQCLLGLGGLHRRAGRSDQARVELDEALARFSSMNMTIWIERTRSELDPLGAP
jgi:class 3 adenylate cyclase/tetratricopeptide (TPR) repeat protein